MKKEENAVIKMKSQKIKKTMDKDNLIIGIVVGIVVLLTVVLVSYYFCFAGSEKVATYDGGEITRAEYELYYKHTVPYIVYIYGVNPSELTTYIVENAVVEEILYEQATEAGYDKSNIPAEEKKQIEQDFASEDSIKAIRQMGVNPDKLQELYYKQAIVSAYVKDMKSKVTVDEMKEYLIGEEGEKVDLNVYNTRHILLAFEENMTDKEKSELLNKAKKLLDTAKKSKDFAKLAMENSDDSSKKDGGAVAIVNNESYFKEYREAVLKLKPGKIYDSVVESQAGYHIIKLDDIDKDGRLTDEKEIDTYVNAKVMNLTKEANMEMDEERIKNIASGLAVELGLVTTTDTTETEVEEDTKSETETKKEEK